MDAFQELKDKLELTPDNHLLLEGVPMILTPRWFFVGIMKQVIEQAGPEIAQRIYYEAGFDGAYKWCNVQIGKGLGGRSVMEQYLGSMTHRGWGRFEIVSLDETQGRGLFWFYESAMALEYGRSGHGGCTWVSGAVAGGVQAILNHAGSDLKVRGRETKCLSEGKPHCEFVVEPAV